MSVATVRKDREQQLIERIADTVPSCTLTGRAKGLLLGIGDDAAVLRPIQGRDLVVSCDAFLQGVHFVNRTHTPESVGYKCLARAASDIAAMGAKPTYFLLSLALPVSKTDRWLDRFLFGMRRAARSLGIYLAGGDVSKYPSVVISITVLGEVKPGLALLRSGAQPGDLVYVSGRLGKAQLGLELMLGGLGRRHSLRSLLRAHLYPDARIELGGWLARHRVASAAMDLSDGLSTDLARLCAASHVGAQIWVEQLPRVRIPRKIRGLRGMHKIREEELALHGGEDYELLFTVPAHLVSRLERAPGAGQLVCIGKILRGRKLILTESSGRTSELIPRGWDPFREGQGR